MADPDGVPGPVLRAYGLEGATARRIESLINLTFLVEHGRRRLILQRLHPIFDPAVNLDIEAVTRRLALRGEPTPRLVRTTAGASSFEHAGGLWRALTYVEGVTLHRLDNPQQARAAGAGVARFHLAMEGFEHELCFSRAGVHDTAAHLAALERAMASEGDRARGEVATVGRQILDAARDLPLADFAALPRRLCHGDLKISNLLFAPQPPPRVLCLIDLDTLGWQSMAYELGDALRSWCNPYGEDFPAPELDPALFEAALTGYAEGAEGLLTAAEVHSLVAGTHTVCLELASRFGRDAIEDHYFGWDRQRYSSRRAHNLARARCQLALARSVEAQRDRLEATVRGIWG